MIPHLSSQADDLTFEEVVDALVVLAPGAAPTDRRLLLTYRGWQLAGGKVLPCWELMLRRDDPHDVPVWSYRAASVKAVFYAALFGELTKQNPDGASAHG